MVKGHAFPTEMLRFVRFTISLQYFWCATPVQSKSQVMKEAHDSSLLFHVEYYKKPSPILIDPPAHPPFYN